MSGRTRHWRDGQLITNRKTDRRQGARVKPEDLPDYVLRFMLPTELGFAIAEGPTGVIGVAIETPGPFVTVTGKNREWVLRQAAAYLATIAGAKEWIIPASLRRPEHPGPTPESPWRPAVRFALDLIYVPGASIVVPRAKDPHMIFPVKA